MKNWLRFVLGSGVAGESAFAIATEYSGYCWARLAATGGPASVNL
jgi:hypothetical protein